VTAVESDDPFLWLEEVDSARALAWVHARNAESQERLQASPVYAGTRERLLAVLNSKDRIPYITRRGDSFYNLWQDEAHPRGLWRRTTLDSYRQARPCWDTVLDLDALAATEGENWVWGGAQGLGPEGRRCLISLSRGGADAQVLREFDTIDKAFVNGGFTLPEAKSTVEWIDLDTLYVGTDFGPGSMTEAGYPRVLKRWQRGTPLAAAVTVFEGQPQDTWVLASVDRTPGFERTLFVRGLDFYNSEHFLLQGSQLVKLDLPSDASISFMNSAGATDDTLLLELRSDLTVAGRTWRAGSLLAADAPAWLRGERALTLLFEPTPTRSLAGYTTTRSHVIVNVLDNVASRLEEWQRTAAGFVRRDIDAPYPGALGMASLHDPERADDSLAETYALTCNDHLTPDALMLGHTGSDARELLKTLPAVFDATGMRAEQLFATSADGTPVPYFVAVSYTHLRAHETM
jgi:prolyl oligopeptidase